MNSGLDDSGKTKAYEEMGDKDGARELLSEVMKDGDSAQKGQAQQLLAKLA
jgi:pilus assembly protein FimV